MFGFGLNSRIRRVHARHQTAWQQVAGHLQFTWPRFLSPIDMPPNPSLPPLGLQPIVLGSRYQLWSPPVLDHISGCGYEALECGASEPVACRHELDRRGLRQAGTHLTPARLLDLKPVLSEMRILGGRDLCSSGLFDWHQRTEADYRLTAAILNRAGLQLRQEGIHLHYHNHDFELNERVGDRTALEFLLELFDPEAVDLCVDVGWVAKAGHDPVPFLRRHRERIGYLHLKDFDAEGWAELGRGQVNWPAVMAVLPELPQVRWAMIEQDSSRRDPLESIRLSREYLRENFRY